MIKTLVPDVLGAFTIEGDRFLDDRGYFQVCYSAAFHSEMPHVVQGNLSCSKANVVRGLHVAPMAKICTCIKGKLFDVIADVRVGSPTFGKWFGTWLSEDSFKQVYVPANCAHGFFAAENDTMLLYQQDGLYNPALEREIHWKDPTLGIVWPDAEAYILSAKDEAAGFLRG